MAGAPTIPALCFVLVFFLLLLAPIRADSSESFSRSLSRREMSKRMKREKMSHLHFYFHDIVSGRSPTAVPVARAATTNSSATGFGFLVMIDDPLTAGPDLATKIVGRAQGLYGSADQSEFGLLMAMNFAFLEGKFNGSTLSVLGRNAVFAAAREMPIVGGSGVFRFARGYATARTHWFDTKTGDATVEYNVYVLHY